MVGVILSGLLLPLSLKKVEERDWEFPGAKLHMVAGDFAVVNWQGLSLGIDGWGRRAFTVPVRNYIISGGKLYCLEKRALLRFGRDGLENMWEIKDPPPVLSGFSFEVVRAGDSFFLFYQLAPIYREGGGAREVFLYRLERGVFKRVFRTKTGLCMSAFRFTPWGFLFVAPQVLNGTFYRGFTDFRAAVGLLSPRGVMLSHLNFMGRYVYPRVYKIRGKRAFVGWSEIWEGKHRSGLLRLDLETWTVEKEVGFEGFGNTFTFPLDLFLPGKFPVFIFTASGKLLVFSDDLELIREVPLGLRPPRLSSKEIYLPVMMYMGKTKGHYFLFIHPRKMHADPYVFLPQPLGKHLVLLDRDLDVVEHISVSGNGQIFLDAGEGIVSVVKGGKIEVFRFSP